jgi:hypothetical protein
MGRLSWVECCFPSFADSRCRRTGCDFLDLDDGVDLSPSLATRGGLRRKWLPQRWNLSVNILRAGKRCEKLCGDLLVVQQRKCTLGKLKTFSRLAGDEMTNLWVKLCNLCRVSTVMIAMLTIMRGHGPFPRLVGFGWVGFVRLESSCVGSWYAADVEHVCIIWLQVGCLWALVGLATGVTPVSLWPLIIVGNLGALSC